MGNSDGGNEFNPQICISKKELRNTPYRIPTVEN